MTEKESDEAFERLMEDMQVLYGMKAGQTVTQADIDALNRLDKHWRDNDEDAIDAFNSGRQQGLLEAGGADLVALQNKLDEASIELATKRAISKFDAERGFRRGAQACREMLARFVEQGGDHRTAASIRANWSPTWGDDPGAPKEDRHVAH